MNAYEMLQVSDKASIEVIRAAWAALVRECHPDGPKPNEKRTRALNEAYAVLKDPEKRAKLDLELKPKPKRAPPPEPQFHTVPSQYMSGYPEPYPGMTQADLDQAINDIFAKAPPIVKMAVNVARTVARGRG